MANFFHQGRASFLAATLLLAVAPSAAKAGYLITSADVYNAETKTVHSGNGTLDLLLFTQGVNENNHGSFDGDDAMAPLPHGGNDYSFQESYVTTAGELKAFYAHTFASPPDEIAIFFDIDETMNGGPINNLDLLTIILNPTTIQGSPDPTGDVSSEEQDAINQGYTGGTVLAKLSTAPINLPIVNQGAGFADWYVRTGVFLHSLNDSDVLLFNVSMSSLDNGPESIFLSGAYAPQPPTPDPGATSAPEPASLALLALGSIGIGGFGLRRKKSAA